MRKRVFLAALLLLASSSFAGAAEAKRKVKIPWRAIEDAVRYEIEISSSPEMDPLIEKKTSSSPEATLQLVPGTYYFRIRGLDDESKPGPWSDVEGFAVNPKPPEPVEPRNRQTIGAVAESGLRFRWEGAGKKAVRIEIHDESGAVLARGVKGSELFWRPERPGQYQWRVGFETVVAQEWSPFSSFTVMPQAFKLVEEKAVAAIPLSRYLQNEFDREDKVSRGSEAWLLVRVAQAVVAYSVVDADLGVNASGAALAGAYSVEARWRGGRSIGQRWTWSGSLNFEALHQTVLGNGFTLPRGYARVFYGHEGGAWRIGPFVHLQAGKSGIFVAEDATQARMGTVFRQGVGLGGVVVYRPIPTVGLSLLGMLRNDFGGTTDALPSPLLSSMAFEAGVGGNLALTEGTSLEARLRALQESFRWNALNGASSSLSNLFVLIDVGVGFKF